MWKKKHVTFLTQNHIDKDKIITVLEKFAPSSKNDSEKKIIMDILKNFKNNDFSLLNTQEIQYLSKNTEEKWGKYLIHRYKFNYYEDHHILPDFPIYLLVEPVSACNLRCPFCHQIDDNFTSNQQMMGNMDLNLFKKIVDEAHDGGTQAFTLTCRGEPTLHPQIGEMIEYCSNKFIELKMNTNGTRLNEKLIHQILKSGMTELVFSVDSHYKEEFESLRVGANFESVVANIKKFKEIRDRDYPNSTCITRASGVQMGKQDQEKFKKFWEPLVDHTVMVNMLYRWDIYNNTKNSGSKGFCHYLGRSLSIYFDGSVIPCDIDYEGVLSVGSIKEKSIKEIWHGEKYDKLVNAHKDGKRSKYVPCDRCPIGTSNGN
jgi:radical SAM protein with 4Fe4S-binding SPASM domain|tara:strand:+ start:4623 stop:5741 length:1119 start_codon:yes stop_codon:yes gene_type:complete